MNPHDGSLRRFEGTLGASRGRGARVRGNSGPSRDGVLLHGRGTYRDGENFSVTKFFLRHGYIFSATEKLFRRDEIIFSVTEKFSPRWRKFPHDGRNFSAMEKLSPPRRNFLRDGEISPSRRRFLRAMEKFLRHGENFSVTEKPSPSRRNFLRHAEIFSVTDSPSRRRFLRVTEKFIRHGEDFSVTEKPSPSRRNFLRDGENSPSRRRFLRVTEKFLRHGEDFSVTEKPSPSRTNEQVLRQKKLFECPAVEIGLAAFAAGPLSIKWVRAKAAGKKTRARSRSIQSIVMKVHVGKESLLSGLFLAPGIWALFCVGTGVPQLLGDTRSHTNQCPDSGRQK